MTDHNILFNAGMIQAIAAECDRPGSGKTSTMRVLSSHNSSLNGGPWYASMKRQNWDWEGAELDSDGIRAKWVSGDLDLAGEVANVKPKFQPGDRIWVRENWFIIRPHVSSPKIKRWDSRKPRDLIKGEDAIGYEAGLDRHNFSGGKGRPSIFMPRWASRFTLQVDEVKIIRVQDLTEDEAIAEGVQIYEGIVDVIGTPSGPSEISGIRYFTGDVDDPYEMKECPIDAFADLWDSINKERGFGWDENPLVVMTKFKPRRGNIDEEEKA